MHILARGRLEQRLQLVSGLILFAFVLTHFANHALGLISVGWMEWGQTLRWGVTRSLAGKIVLASALAIHIGLALGRVAQRRTWRMPIWEALQIASGILIPLFLIPHVVGLRVAEELFGLKAFYVYAVFAMWPEAGVTTALLMTLVWLHACIGMHFWLRLSPTYARILPALYAFAVALPLAAYGGFIQAGREVALRAQTAEATARLRRSFNAPDANEAAQLNRIEDTLIYGFYILVGVIVLALLARPLIRAVGTRFDLSYVYGPVVRAKPGPTLLEMSRQFNVPHMSICGGRARCSTCRVRVESGGEHLHPPGGPERRTLASIGAGPDVRLACQARPKSPLTVFRLIPPETESTKPAHQVPGIRLEDAGVERELVILFLDVRGFTRWSEGKLPYDVVFILNTFFAAASQAVTAEGGWIDKYMGDGMLAVFGRDVAPDVAARQALQAAAAIDLALEKVAERMVGEVGETVRVGIGLHSGTVVLGRIGFEEASSVTVIGEAVNTASRLETLAGSEELQLVASQAVMTLADCTPAADFESEVQVKGLRKPISVLGFSSARSILDALPQNTLSSASTTDAGVTVPRA
ncbi:MAG: adenylate/guanylate cyclase domain-containing protein [Pseudomonadota bacterium]